MEFKIFRTSVVLVALFLSYSLLASPSDYKQLDQLLRIETQFDRKESLILPRSALLGYYADPASQSRVEKFINISKTVETSLESQLELMGFDLSNVQVFIIGNKMESFYSYVNLMGGNRIRREQFSHLPLSRPILPVKPDLGGSALEPIFRAYIDKTLTPYLSRGMDIILIDTFFKGRSLAEVYRASRDVVQRTDSPGVVLPVGILEEKEGHQLKLTGFDEGFLSEKMILVDSRSQILKTMHSNTRWPLALLNLPFAGFEAYQTFMFGPNWMRSRYHRFDDHGEPVAESTDDSKKKAFRNLLRPWALMFYQDIYNCARLLEPHR